MCLALICAPGRWWRSLLLRMLRTRHSDRCAMSALADSAPGASKGLKSARHRPQNPICFRVDGSHANGLVSYASDAKQLHNKQTLGEARGVRCDKLAQRLDKNFTLWQRVKLRLAEPVDAFL